MKNIGIDATVLNYNKEGIGNYLSNLNRELVRQGSQYTFTFFVFDEKDIDSVLPPTKNARYKIMKVKQPQGILSGFRTARIVGAKARAANLDLMISTHSHLTALLFQPSFMVVHDISPIVHPEYFGRNSRSLRKRLFNFLFQAGLKASDQILTTSNFNKTEIQNHYKLADKTISVIGAGPSDLIKLQVPEADKLKILKELSACRTKLWQTDGIKRNKYFLHLGTLSPRKNVSTLLLAFADFLKSENDGLGKEYKLVIAGKKGWDYDQIFKTYTEIQNKKPELKFDKKVIFTGFVSNTQVKTLIEESTALIYPSAYEGFGMPILEALLLQKEVIASDIEVFRENFDSACHFFDPSSVKQLTQQLKKVAAGNKKNSSKLAQQLNNKYNWQVVARNLINVITNYFNAKA